MSYLSLNASPFIHTLGWGVPVYEHALYDGYSKSLPRKITPLPVQAQSAFLSAPSLIEFIKHTPLTPAAYHHSLLDAVSVSVQKKSSRLTEEDGKEFLFQSLNSYLWKSDPSIDTCLNPWMRAKGK